MTAAQPTPRPTAEAASTQGELPGAPSSDAAAPGGASTASPTVRERDRNEEGRAENARPRDRFGAPLPRGSVDEMADKEEPEDVVSTVEEAFDRAVSLFDQQRFFEAHEFLEYIWKHDAVDPADRDFWKGVTQVAVGCCHTQRGNDSGAVTLLRRAATYMAPYPSPFHAVDTGRLSQIAAQVAQAVEDRGAGPDLDFPAFPRA